MITTIMITTVMLSFDTYAIVILILTVLVILSLKDLATDS